MSEEALPKFKYHPDPIATGSIEKSDATCVVCQRKRGCIYVGPAYAEEEYDACICPWCIADGTAHDELDVSFHDQSGIGGNGEWDEVDEEIVEEVAYRTPGFNAWQQEQWWTHCDDAAMFLGAMGTEELLALGKDAVDAIKAANIEMPRDEWDAFFESLDKDASPTAYLFKCIKCGKLGGYTDAD